MQFQLPLGARSGLASSLGHSCFANNTVAQNKLGAGARMERSSKAERGVEPKAQLGHRSRGLCLRRPGETGQDVVRSGIGKMALSWGGGPLALVGSPLFQSPTGSPVSGGSHNPGGTQDPHGEME